jgi:hypothetical protein
MAKREKKTGPLIFFTTDDREFLAEFERSSQDHVNRVTKTKESAMQELVDAGIYDRRGKLCKQYRSVA